jgi:hypothetical protein
VRSRPDIRIIPFAVSEFGTLGGHATAFLTALAKQVASSRVASWCRKVSLAVHVAQADNVLREIESEIQTVYNMYRVKHVVVSRPSLLCLWSYFRMG